MTISDPAILFKNGKVVYKESHPNVFYDSIEFWNNLEGIAVGDFTENCISIIITRDGGETWNKLDCSLFENIKEGEGFFAASDTNIPIINDKVWLASEESIVEFIFLMIKVLVGKYLILQLFKENLQREYLVLIFMTRKMVLEWEVIILNPK